LKNRSWQGEDGNMRYSTEVHVTDFTFLTPRDGAQAPPSSAGAPSASAPSAGAYTPPAPSQEAPDEDDLPF